MIDQIGEGVVPGGSEPQGFAANTYNSNDSHLEPSITWEASEYVHHEKGAGWLAVVGLIVVAGVGLALWFQQWIFAFLLLVMGAAFGYYAVRKPHTIHYELSDDGLVIDKKVFPMSNFSAFGVIDDGALYSIRLIPVKRLAPAIVIYFAEEDGEKIVDILGGHMPMERMEPDLIDLIMRRLHF